MLQINKKLLRGIPRKIKEIKLNENAPVMELTNLNLKPGKTYELIICEYSTTKSTYGHYLRINNIDTGYIGSQMFIIQNSDAEDKVPAMRANHTNIGLVFTNGWNVERDICFTKITLEYFNKNWISCSAHLTSAKLDSPYGQISVIQNGHYNTSNGVEEINTIGVYPFDGDLIGAGSYIILYEK